MDTRVYTYLVLLLSIFRTGYIKTSHLPETRNNENQLTSTDPFAPNAMEVNTCTQYYDKIKENNAFARTNVLGTLSRVHT